MRPDQTTTLLNRVRRRLWLLSLSDRLALGFVFASAILGVAAVLHTFLANMKPVWWASLALLPIVAAVVAAVVSRPSLEASARAADRWLNTHDLLTAAWYLKSRKPGSNSPAARVVLDQADQFAANAPRSLPRPGADRRPVPVAFAVAVFAISLFLLSLDGVEPSGHLPNRSLSGVLNRNESVRDDWAPVLEPAVRDERPLAAGPRPMSEPADRSAAQSSAAPPQGLPIPQARERGDSGGHARADASGAAPGAGAGQIASAAPPEGPGRQDSDGTAAAELREVTVQRKPGGEGMVVDRAVSVDLIPVSAAPRKPAGAVQDVPAARVGRHPFSPASGPAHIAFQARYFEEARQID